MGFAETPQSGPEVVVAEDGSVPAIPAEILARYGLNRPGAHLRLVEVSGMAGKPKTTRGMLKGLIDADAITNALEENKAERIAAVMVDEEK